MFRENFVIVACFVAVVLTGPPSYSKNLKSVHNKANEALELVESEPVYDKDVEQVKIILKSVFDSIENRAHDSLNEALEETAHATRGIVKEGEYDSVFDIIEIIKQCVKQIMSKSKDRAEALMKELKSVIEDMLKIRDCIGSKKDRGECIKKNIALIKQDLSNLMDDSSKQVQWLMNDVLPDFYQCVTA